MKGKTVILLLTIWLGLIFSVSAQAGFEVLGKGPRPAAMGGAFTALANDPNAMWFNPAGLAQLQQRQAVVMYARLLPGLNFDKLHNFLIGYVQPVGALGNLGVGWCGLQADVYSENMFSVAYARSWKDRLLLGITGKWLQWSAEPATDPETGKTDQDFSKSSIGLDVGAIFEIGKFFDYATLRVGVAAQNLNEPNISKSGAEAGKMPRTLKVGLLVDTETYLVEADVLHQGDQTKVLMGFELKVASYYDFRFRGGTTQLTGDYEGGEFSGGFGFTVKGIAIDYAFLYSTQIKRVGGSHKFSLGYKF